MLLLLLIFNPPDIYIGQRHMCELQSQPLNTKTSQHICAFLLQSPVNICSHPVEDLVEETLVHTGFIHISQLEIPDVSFSSSSITVIQGPPIPCTLGARPPLNCWIIIIAETCGYCLIRIWNANTEVISNLVQLNFHSCDSLREVTVVWTSSLCSLSRFSYAPLKHYHAKIPRKVSDHQLWMLHTCLVLK